MLNNKEAEQDRDILLRSGIINYLFVNNLLPGELFRNFAELFRSQLELFAVKIDVVFAVHRYQMDVCMGNFESQHHYCHLPAGGFPLDSGCNLLGKEHHAGKGLVIEVEDIVDLLLGNDERMPFGQRIDVEECVVAVVFGDLVGGNLPRNDA